MTHRSALGHRSEDGPGPRLEPEMPRVSFESFEEGTAPFGSLRQQEREEVDQLRRESARLTLVVDPLLPVPIGGACLCPNAASTPSPTASRSCAR